MARPHDLGTGPMPDSVTLASLSAQGITIRRHTTYVYGAPFGRAWTRCRYSVYDQAGVNVGMVARPKPGWAKPLRDRLEREGKSRERLRAAIKARSWDGFPRLANGSGWRKRPTVHGATVAVVAGALVREAKERAA